MPPKNKYTKEQVIQAAVQVVREKGLDGLTAKTLAAQLGTSTQPIFTYFDTMDAVKKAVYDAALDLYNQYAARGLAEKIPFFGLGIQYIRFAREEPQLYRLLFLRREPAQGVDALTAMQQSQEAVRPSLMSIYRISAPDADRYFRDLWLVVHSLATLIVTGCCPYSEREIGQILTGFSVSICKSIKEIPGFTTGDFDRDAVFRRLIGTPETDHLVVYVHGKGGSVAEAEHYKPLFPTSEVVGFDYQAQTPWEAREEFAAYFARQRQRCRRLTLIANSIGAFFSLSALDETLVDEAYLISPVVDMEKLIQNMLSWAGVTEQDLAEKQEIPTDFGETLSWPYLTYVRAHPITWRVPTHILYGERDNLTSPETISAFARRIGAGLTVLPGGEHWFHTEEQMQFLDAWLIKEKEN